MVCPAITDVSHAYTLCKDFAAVVAAKHEEWSDPEDIPKKEKTVFSETNMGEGTSARMSELRRSIEAEFVGDLLTAGITYYALPSSCDRTLAKAGRVYFLRRPRTNRCSTVVEECWHMAHYAIGMADEPVNEYVDNLGQVVHSTP